MEVLDADRVAELVEATKEGRLPDHPSQSSRRGPRVRTLDFSRPTKFGADHQRRINRATEAFCQTAGTRLSSELRWPLELETLSTTQLTWSATQQQIAPRSLLALVDVEPLETRMVVTLEQSAVLVCLECMLGGSPDAPARDRRLSELDWALAQSLFESLLMPLSQAWQELGGVSLRLSELRAHDATEVASVSEPTYGTQIEVRINQQSYSMSLLVPWTSIEPVEHAVSGRSDDDEITPDAGAPLEGPMGAVPVTLRAEVAHTEMAVKDILALAPGDVITFDANAEDGVHLFADAVRIAQARPGRHGRRRALQLTEFNGEERR